MTTGNAPPAREPALDALRGFALFGILAVNLPFFAGPEPFAGGWLRTAFPGALDQAAFFTVHALFAGKFIAIFSVLFGFGAARQLAEGGTERFRRRLGALALIGLVHAVWLFAGDILLTYAVLGLALPRAARWPTRNLLRAALWLWLASIALNACLGALIASGPPFDPLDSEALIALHRSSDVLAIAANRVSDFVPLFAVNLLVGGPQVLGLMLLGMAGFRRLGGRPPAEAAGDAARRVAPFWIPALLGNLLYAAAATSGAYGGSVAATGLAMPLFAIVTPFLALVLAGTALGLFAGRGAAVARPFAAAGRLSLSVYIAQSVACGLIFNGYGIGLYGSVGPAGCLTLALTLYAAMLGLATLWSRHVGRGPLEWLVERVVGPRPAAAPPRESP